MSSLLINDLKNKDDVYAIVVSELRKHGIKYRKEKVVRGVQDKYKHCKRIFNVPLHTLELTDVELHNGGIVEVPAFVLDACGRIREQINTEGLFRKASSSKRLQDIRNELEAGKPLGRTHNGLDVANILKMFFRDLPEPLLPTGNIQEALLRCLLGSGELRVNNLLMTCLLLPPLTLNTLAYFMQFLHSVAQHSSQNRMTAENLAIILTPNVMPIAEKIQQRLNSHVEVVKLLIEHAERIAVVPDDLLLKLSEAASAQRTRVSPSRDDSRRNISVLTRSNTEKKKKKRRSGSLTRMFNGIRKIVGVIGSSESLDKTDELNESGILSSANTPCLSKSTKKRRVNDGIPFSAKKRKEIMATLPDKQEILSGTPITISKEMKKSRLSIGGGKKQTKLMGAGGLITSLSIASINESNKPMERRWSVVGAPWGRKKRSKQLLQKVESCTQTEEDDEGDGEGEKTMSRMSPSLPCLTKELEEAAGNFDPEMEMLQLPSIKRKVLFDDDEDDESFGRQLPERSSLDASGSEGNEDGNGGARGEEKFLKIFRNEYEAIKERVCAIETRLSQEFGGCNDVDNIERVEDKYLQTLEHTEPIESACTTTDQLAKRLSRELKIRRSAEHKMIRSPSARKIGSIRRRSREHVRLSRNQSWHVGNSSSAGAGGPPNAKMIVTTAEISFYPKTNLKRGRPNTVQTGLKHPEPDSPKITTTLEMEKQPENWISAENFFHNQSGAPMSVDVSFGTPNATCSPAISTPAPKIDCFKTPEPGRRASLRSESLRKQMTTPNFVTWIEGNEVKTPMLPPTVPPRKTPGRTPMLPPKTPGRSDTLGSAAKSHITPLREAQTGRESIARIRSQNAGMVMAKAKLFDGLVSSKVGKQQQQPQQQQHPLAQEKKPIVQRRGLNDTTTGQSDAVAKKINSTQSVIVEHPLTVRQVQRVRTSSTHSVRSPRKTTPRKQRGAFTKATAHGGAINRREKLRLVSKSAASSSGAASSKSYGSPRMLKKLQQAAIEATAVENLGVIGGPSSKAIRYSNNSPRVRRPLGRSSPRRILAAKTPGQDNRPQHQRVQTPLKATPISRLATSTGTAATRGSPEKTPKKSSRQAGFGHNHHRLSSASSVLRT